jgi:AcrR family transcriptional regulator
MHRTLEEALEREPRTEDGRERMARAIDAILGLARDRPRLMRTHMAGILMAESFVQCPEQQRLASLLQDTVTRFGSADPESDYRLLRALLMGAVFAMLVPGAPMPQDRLRSELFHRYGLDWESGIPPGAEPPPAADDGPVRTAGADKSAREAVGAAAAGPEGSAGPVAAGPAVAAGPTVMAGPADTAGPEDAHEFGEPGERGEPPQEDSPIDRH